MIALYALLCMDGNLLLLRNLTGNLQKLIKFKSGQGLALQALSWVSLPGYLSRINLSYRHTFLASLEGWTQAAEPAPISVRKKSFQTRNLFDLFVWRTWYENIFISKCTTAMANSVKPHIPKKENVGWLFSYLFWSKICGAEKGTGRWQAQNKQKIAIPHTTDQAVELLAVGFFGW